MTTAMPLDWNLVRRGVTDAFRSSLHCSVATSNEDGSPHLTPIGSVLLTEAGRGIYFEIFATQVMPHFQGQLDWPRRSHEWIANAKTQGGSSTAWLDETRGAMERAETDYVQHGGGVAPPPETES